MRRLVLTTLTLMLIEPARFMLISGFVAKAKRTHPEMFDGAAALASVKHCVEEYAAHYEL